MLNCACDSTTHDNRWKITLSYFLLEWKFAWIETLSWNTSIMKLLQYVGEEQWVEFEYL